MSSWAALLVKLGIKHHESFIKLRNLLLVVGFNQCMQILLYCIILLFSVDVIRVCLFKRRAVNIQALTDVAKSSRYIYPVGFVCSYKEAQLHVIERQRIRVCMCLPRVLGNTKCTATETQDIGFMLH